MGRVRYERMRVERTARYGLLGNPGGDVREVWFALHGYGHSAEVFLGAFEPLRSPRRLFVAPEGLSRFYLQGSRGEVGASWMTKVEREGEIADQLIWLDALHARIFGELSREAVSVHVFGFSQGAAAVCRWIANGAVRPDRVTLWAGSVPPDLDLDAFRAKLPPEGLTLVLGRRDPFLRSGRAEAEIARLEEASLPFELVRHDGGHRIDEDLLVELLG